MYNTSYHCVNLNELCQFYLKLRGEYLMLVTPMNRNTGKPYTQEELVLSKQSVELQDYALKKPYDEFERYVKSKDERLIRNVMQFPDIYGHRILYHIYASGAAKDMRRMKLCMAYGAEPFYPSYYGCPPGSKKISAASYTGQKGYTKEDHEELQRLFTMGLPAYETYEKEKKAQLQAAELIRQRQQEEIQRQAEMAIKQQEEAKRKALEDQRIRLLEEQRRLEQIRLAEKEAERQREETRSKAEEEQRKRLAEERHFEQIRLAEKEVARQREEARLLAVSANSAEGVQIALEMLSICCNKWWAFANEKTQSHPDAFTKGLSLAIFDLASLIRHPIDNFLFPISEFFADTVIIAAHHNIGNSLDKDIAYLRLQLTENPKWYIDATTRMKARGENIGQIMNHYLYKAEPEEYTREFARILVPAYFFKAGKVFVTMQNNLKNFNQLHVPLFMPADTTPLLPKEIKALSVEQVRNHGRRMAPSIDPLMYVITKEGKVIITEQIYDHWHLGKGEPVAAAGDIYVNTKGNICRADTRSGSYAPSHPKLPNLVVNKLNELFSEVTVLTFVDFNQEIREIGEATLKPKMYRPNPSPSPSPHGIFFGAATTKENETKVAEASQKKLDVSRKKNQSNRKSNFDNSLRGRSLNTAYVPSKGDDNAQMKSSLSGKESRAKLNETPQNRYITLLLLLGDRTTIWSRSQVMNWIKSLRIEAQSIPKYLKSSRGFYFSGERNLLILSLLEKKVIQYFDTTEKTLLFTSSLKQLYGFASDEVDRKEVQAERDASQEEKTARKSAYEQAINTYVASIKADQERRKMENFKISSIHMNHNINRNRDRKLLGGSSSFYPSHSRNSPSSSSSSHSRNSSSSSSPSHFRNSSSSSSSSHSRNSYFCSYRSNPNYFRQGLFALTRLAINSGSATDGSSYRAEGAYMGSNGEWG